MATILDTLKKGTEYLQKHEIEEARLSMELLIAHVLDVRRMQIYIDFDRDIPEGHLDTLRELTKRRGRGEPLQHLLGTVEFCDLDFKTDHRALIPRPETEELTRKLLSRDWPPSVSILDLGCGSGVIGISLAHRLMGREARFTLADISKEALLLARENAGILPDEGARIQFVESDLFSALEGMFDLIVANLPYIPDNEESQLSREVRNDPAVALFGGAEGTEIMRRFLSQAQAFLNPGGSIAMEFGIGQAETLRNFAAELCFHEIAVQPDLSGIDRFLFATKSAESA